MIQNARAALRRVRRVLLQAPTGAGKTALASFMAGESGARGRSVYFICHRAELVEGTSRTFRKFGIPHGIIAAGHRPDMRVPVQICSVDTLKNRVAVMPEPSLAIWDECHHMGAAGWQLIMKAWDKAYHIGLSATPWRLDGSGLDGHFDDMVLGPKVSWLIENGFLSPYRIYAPNNPDMKGVRKQMGDFAKGEAAERMDKPKITGDMITHYMKHAAGLRAVAFAITVAHSQHIAAQFCASGIKAAHLDGGTPKGERKRIIEGYASGEIQVLTNVDLFGEGFDLSAIAQRDVTIDCVIQARPTQSLSLHLQQVGRALRPGEGKTAIILDHAGNSARHGFPDDDREWTLEGREKGRKAAANDDGPPPPITCEGCFIQIRRPAPPCCPGCGKRLQAEVKEIKVADGELKELTEADKAKMRAERQREERECKDLGALVALGVKRGYQFPTAWANKRFAAGRRK